MSKQTKRAHVVIPEDLLDEVDQLVGPRQRSEFFVEAARERIARERLRQVASDFAGSFKDADILGWETPEATSTWVRTLRRQSDARALSGNDGE